MNIPNANVITQSLTEDLISRSISKGLEVKYLKEKHQILIEDSSDWLAKIYLPWNLEFDSKAGFSIKDDFHYALVMIRAGQAVMGYFHDGNLLDHKVFRAYMVRQKQGKSQIKYLKTKGKSRSGSRIRLGETERFFEEINERLNEYSSNFPIEIWGISCGKTLWPYYFESETAPPFSQNQENLISLPFHIAQASFEALENIRIQLGKFHLLLSEKGKSTFSEPGTFKPDLEINSDNW